MSELESYVPVEEVADYLSVKVSTIRQWVNKGFIPKTTYIKVGYTYRFNIPAVIEALKQEEPNPDATQTTQEQELNFNEEDDL